MTELQQNRYDQLLRRVGDLKGPGSKVNDVLQELFPMFDVENLPAELYILGRTDLCWGGAFFAGVMGQAGRGQLFNPVGSGKIMTITKAGIACRLTTVVRWGRRDTPLTTHFQTQLFRDVRHPSGNLPTGQVRGQTSVALANATGQILNPSNTPLLLTDPNDLAVLTAGTGFEIGVNNNDTDVHFFFNWRERVAEPSELNF